MRKTEGTDAGRPRVISEERRETQDPPSENQGWGTPSLSVPARATRQGVLCLDNAFALVERHPKLSDPSTCGPPVIFQQVVPLPRRGFRGLAEWEPDVSASKPWSCCNRFFLAEISALSAEEQRLDHLQPPPKKLAEKRVHQGKNLHRKVKPNHRLAPLLYFGNCTDEVRTQISDQLRSTGNILVGQQVPVRWVDS